jgi:hypothetical protein
MSRYILKLKNSWEELPKKNGAYFIISGLGYKEVLLFDESYALWYKPGQEERTCPSCTRFQWIDMEAE